MYIEKKPTLIDACTGMHLRLYLGKMEQSELWLIEPILSAPSIIINSKT